MTKILLPDAITPNRSLQVKRAAPTAQTVKGAAHLKPIGSYFGAVLARARPL